MVDPTDLDPPARQVKPTVFLHDFVDVDRPVDEVAGRLDDGAGWLGSLATAAGDETGALLVRIGPTWSLGDWVARDVRVRLGLPMRHGHAMVVPVRWEDANRPGFFPVLDGDMEVAPLGADRCRIVMNASYRPPFEGVGRAIDQAILHRVAESTVRSFLHRVAAALELGDGE
jgi:hypothetical protein